MAEILAEYAAADSRIKVVRRTENGHISAASQLGAGAGPGDWVACLDHDDVLAEHALAVAVLAIAEHPDARLVYSDEDKIDESGDRRTPVLQARLRPAAAPGSELPQPPVRPPARPGRSTSAATGKDSRAARTGTWRCG